MRLLALALFALSLLGCSPSRSAPPEPPTGGPEVTTQTISSADGVWKIINHTVRRAGMEGVYDSDPWWSTSLMMVYFQEQLVDVSSMVHGVAFAPDDSRLLCQELTPDDSAQWFVLDLAAGETWLKPDRLERKIGTWAHSFHAWNEPDVIELKSAFSDQPDRIPIPPTGTVTRKSGDNN